MYSSIMVTNLFAGRQIKNNGVNECSQLTVIDYQFKKNDMEYWVEICNEINIIGC